MRCVDVIREVSAPTGSVADSALNDHLARCPRCAAWAERDARLGRLLDATRPDEPSLEEWDGVWGGICERLDQPAGAILPMTQPARSRRAFWVVLGVAQAAAVLLAVLAYNEFKPAPGRQVVQNVQPVTPTPPPESRAIDEPVDIPSGELVLIREEKGRVEMVELALNGNLGQVDPAYEALNVLEAIAE